MEQPLGVPIHHRYLGAPDGRVCPIGQGCSFFSLRVPIIKRQGSSELVGHVGEKAGFHFVQCPEFMGLGGQHGGLPFEEVGLGFELLVLVGHEFALGQQHGVFSDFEPLAANDQASNDEQGQ